MSGDSCSSDARSGAAALRAQHAGVDRSPAAAESCDYCGSNQLVWRKCKLVCLSCAQINKSCADL